MIMLHLRVCSEVGRSRPRSCLILLSRVRLFNTALRWLLTSINATIIRGCITGPTIILSAVNRDVQLIVDHVDRAVAAALPCWLLARLQVVGGVSEAATCCPCLLHSLLLEVIRWGQTICLPRVALSLLSLLQDELPLCAGLGLGHFSDRITV